MVKVVKGNRTVEAPGKVVTAGIITVGLCVIVANICDAVSNKH